MGALFSTETRIGYYDNEEVIRRIRQSSPPSYSTSYNSNYSSTNYREPPRRTLERTPVPSTNRSDAASCSTSHNNNYHSTFNVPSRPQPLETKNMRVYKTSIANLKIYQQKLCSAIIMKSAYLNWDNKVNQHQQYQLNSLEKWTSEYSTIMSKFAKGILGEISVTKIERIENTYLLGQFCIKKLEFLNKNLPVEERILFHGTKRVYLDSICQDNFNWRLHGQTKGNKFGKGVSFTPKSSYANHYCDRKGDKIMIVSKVLVSRTCEGSEDMEIPNYFDRRRLIRYDTSIKQTKKDVLVKYCDDEFYPAYLIHYTGKMYYPNKDFYR